ncbi:hypothetical protein NKG05_29010 [Oerskovia sp. M15]
MSERNSRIAYSGDETCAGAEVVDQVAGMQSLGQFAPVGQPGVGDLLARQHVHVGDFPVIEGAELELVILNGLPCACHQ